MHWIVVFHIKGCLGDNTNGPKQCKTNDSLHLEHSLQDCNCSTLDINKQHPRHVFLLNAQMFPVLCSFVIVVLKPFLNPSRFHLNCVLTLFLGNRSRVIRKRLTLCWSGPARWIDQPLYLYLSPAQIRPPDIICLKWEISSNTTNS